MIKNAEEDQKTPEQQKAEDKKRYILTVSGILFILTLVCLIVALLVLKEDQTKIPITFNEIKTHMEGIGLACGDLQKSPETNVGSFKYDSVCKGEFPEDTTTVWVEIYAGKNKRDIYLIKSTVEQLAADPSDEITIKYLSYIAALPYEGSSPDKAILWTGLNLPKAKQAQTTDDHPRENFGGVQFEISFATDWGGFIILGESRD